MFALSVVLALAKFSIPNGKVLCIVENLIDEMTIINYVDLCQGFGRCMSDAFKTRIGGLYSLHISH